MIRAHRRFHKLFWLIAAPLLLLFFLVFQPEGKNSLMPAQDIPDGLSIAIFNDATDTAVKTQEQ